MTLRTPNAYGARIALTMAMVVGTAVIVAGGASATPTASPSAATGLSVTVDAPGEANAGSPYTATMAYTDDAGDVIAAVSSWGDSGIGWSTPPSCEQDATPAGPAAGTETFDHTWSEPGRYTVDLSITTGGCGVEDETESVSFEVVVS